MRLRILIAATGAVALAGTRASDVPGPHRHEPRTVWDSVYADSQAVRGDSIYQRACAACHGPALAGTDSAAELTGKGFLGNWEGVTLDQLYDKILTSMPPDEPGSVPGADVAAVMADILARNGFPAGPNPLGQGPDQLKDITLVTSRP